MFVWQFYFHFFLKKSELNPKIFKVRIEHQYVLTPKRNVSFNIAHNVHLIVLCWSLFSFVQTAYEMSEALKTICNILIILGFRFLFWYSPHCLLYGLKNEDFLFRNFQCLPHDLQLTLNNHLGGVICQLINPIKGEVRWQRGCEQDRGMFWLFKQAPLYLSQQWLFGYWLVGAGGIILQLQTLHSCILFLQRLLGSQVSIQAF